MVKLKKNHWNDLNYITLCIIGLNNFTFLVGIKTKVYLKLLIFWNVSPTKLDKKGFLFFIE